MNKKKCFYILWLCILHSLYIQKYDIGRHQEEMFNRCLPHFFYISLRRPSHLHHYWKYLVIFGWNVVCMLNLNPTLVNHFTSYLSSTSQQILKQKTKYTKSEAWFTQIDIQRRPWVPVLLQHYNISKLWISCY